jgi:hypothetical protein
MLIVALIVLPWLALLCLFLALCRAAAHGDEALVEIVHESHEHAFLPRLLISRDAPELDAADLRPAAPDSTSERVPTAAAR